MSKLVFIITMVILSIFAVVLLIILLHLANILDEAELCSKEFQDSQSEFKE